MALKVPDNVPEVLKVSFKSVHIRRSYTESVRDIGVHFDSQLTIETHISKVVSSCHYQLRRSHQVRRLVGHVVPQLLVSAFKLPRIDYCNSLLSRLPWSTVIQPQ